MRIRALLPFVVVGLLAGGCGSDEEAGPAAPERKEESADKLPQLKPGFEEFVNRDAGIAFGRPPGWEAKEDGARTTVDAPDALVSMTVTIDRTDEAVGGDPKTFAPETLELLPGYEKPLKASKPEPFGHEYEGAIVEAKGVASKSGVPQLVRVVVLARKGVAIVTAVIAENTEEDAGGEAKQALEAVRTLRTRPPA